MFFYQFVHSSDSILGVWKKTFTTFALQVYTHFFKNWLLSQPTLSRAIEARLTGASSIGGKCAESPLTFIERKMLEKPKETGHEEYSRFRSYLYVWGKVLAPLTFVPKDNSLRLELCEIMYLSFYFLFYFWGRQKWGSCSYVPSIEEEIRPM